jgi:hypothetical protein
MHPEVERLCRKIRATLSDFCVIILSQFVTKPTFSARLRNIKEPAGGADEVPQFSD